MPPADSPMWRAAVPVVIASDKRKNHGKNCHNAEKSLFPRFHTIFPLLPQSGGWRRKLANLYLQHNDNLHRFLQKKQYFYIIFCQVLK
jgi:hypothetical protein